MIRKYNLKNEIDISILREAVKNTFEERNSFEYLKDYKEIILSIKNSEKIEKLWQIYSDRYKYANNISIDKILDLLLKNINELDIEVVML